MGPPALHLKWLTTILVPLFLLGCGGQSQDSTEEPSEDSSEPTQEPTTATTSAVPAAEPYTGFPGSLAVLGHSQATGENTEPYEGDPKNNTWASGTNPEVESVYQRVLAHNPQTRDNVFNYAQPSASIWAIASQAEQAVAERPDLVLVQAIDADIMCPASRTDYQDFGDGVAAVLDTIASESPSTRVFFTTQYGSPDTYVESLTPAQRRELGSRMGGPGPCAFVGQEGRIVREEINRLEQIIVGYEQRMAEVCDARPNCDHDHGAFSNIVELSGDYTEDLDHLSIQGHARAAKVAYAALQDVGLIPEK
jgi:hypothetical protein